MNEKPEIMEKTGAITAEENKINGPLPPPKKRYLNKTKVITYSAALSALSMLIVLFMPTLDIGITSVTPGSHVSIMLAMMIHPVVAAATGIVTTLSFLLKGVPYQIVFRAASHLIFAIPCSFLALKLLKPQEKTIDYKRLTIKALILNGVSAAIHAAAEMIAVYFAFLVLTSFATTVKEVFLIVGLITLAHSVIDFFIAFAIYIPLRRARLVNILG